MAMTSIDRPASYKQRSCLYVLTGRCLDLRKMNMSLQQASEFITRIKSPIDPLDIEIAAVKEQLIKMGATVNAPKDRQVSDKESEQTNFAQWWEEAHKQADVAARSCMPMPMAVEGESNIWILEGGTCGFAWIYFPANTKFGKWAKETKRAEKRDYAPGLDVWVHDYGQSLTRKETYARKFAEVINAFDPKIKAKSGSRID